MKFSDETYKTLKWVTLIGLPALATFMGVLLPAIGVDPEAIKIVLTVISGLTAFIGTLIGISTTAYNSDTHEQ